MEVRTAKTMSRILTVSLLWVTAGVVLASEPQGPVSVCELMAHRAELDRHVVLVRGAIGGGGHGTWLVASPTCTHRLTTRGVTWPNIVFLTLPNNQSKDPAFHADFAPDMRAIERANRDAVRAGYNGKDNHMVATYEGLLVTYLDLAERVSPGVPGALRLGFGPLVGAPAQLLIRTVKDVTVVSNRQENQ